MISFPIPSPLLGDREIISLLYDMQHPENGVLYNNVVTKPLLRQNRQYGHQWCG
jgi:hypothetical protein